jgi:hypothetical protein
MGISPPRPHIRQGATVLQQAQTQTDSPAWGPRYIASGRTEQKTQFQTVLLSRGYLRSCDLVVVEACLLCRALVLAVSYGSTILAFSGHVTIRSTSSFVSVELVSPSRSEISSHHIVFKRPVPLIYHLFYIYFLFKCNLLFSDLSSSLQVSAVYRHHQVSSSFLNCCTG